MDFFDIPFLSFLLGDLENQFNETDMLKLAMVEDILDMIENCRTEDTLRQELLEYFDGIEFEVIE